MVASKTLSAPEPEAEAWRSHWTPDVLHQPDRLWLIEPLTALLLNASTMKRGS